jgi:ATP-binding cassette subfamily B protein
MDSTLNNKNIKNMVKIIFTKLSITRRLQLLFLLFFTIFAGIAEVISIGAVLPFLGVLINPEIIINSSFVISIPKLHNVLNTRNSIAVITFVFIFFTISAGLIRIFLIWMQTRVSYEIGIDFSIEMYRRTLYQDYMAHVNQNSSHTISSIANKSTTIVSNAIQPTITIISSTIMLSMILISLFIIDPFIATTGLLGFLFIYLLVIFFVKGGLKKSSEKISIHQVKTLKALQEGLNGIRDILLDCNQDKYLREFSNSEILLRRAYANTYVLGVAPRFGIEAFGMILIAIIAYSVSETDAGVYSALPILGALALGAQRMLPLMQQIYTGWTSLVGGKDSIYDALEILCLKVNYLSNEQLGEKLIFERAIRFEGVSFRYDVNADWVLRDVNILIPKGAIVGVIGESGAGKSTLLDLMMGLLIPTSGVISVDSNTLSEANKSCWYKQVSHVPQSIFLADATIEENIAFSESSNKIDFEKIERNTPRRT